MFSNELNEFSLAMGQCTITVFTQNIYVNNRAKLNFVTQSVGRLSCCAQALRDGFQDVCNKKKIIKIFIDIANQFKEYHSSGYLAFFEKPLCCL